MPSRDFVATCIGGPKNIKKSDYFIFTFGLEIGTSRTQFFVYKDFSVLGATRRYLLSLDSLSEIIDIDIDSGDSYYNLVFETFKIQSNSIFRCMLLKKWRDDYQIFNYEYYFCYDDFPLKNRGISTITGTYYPIGASEFYRSSFLFSHYALFLNRFFKNKNWFENKYISAKNHSNEITVYTTVYGSSAYCSYGVVGTSLYFSNNCGCIILPFSVSYSINNFSVVDDSLYDNNFVDSNILTSHVYYLTLDTFYDGVCCLAECFGITE